jgi:hypothetical protein
MAFHSIIVYEIINNGDILNGIFTANDKPKYLIYNEIATKISGIANRPIGKYNLRFTDINGVSEGEMEITYSNGVYEFLQVVYDGTTVICKFRGLGFKSGNNHLSFSYWQL